MSMNDNDVNQRLRKLESLSHIHIQYGKVR